jgi:hypothetical protein
VLTGPDTASYYHEKFLRGKPELAQTIARKGKGSRRASGTLPQDPNFYAVPCLPNTSASKGSQSPEVSSSLGTSAAPITHETGADGIANASITGGYAAMDPTLSLATAIGDLSPAYALRVETLLQLQLLALHQQEQQRQQQLRSHLLWSILQQDIICHGTTIGPAPWQLQLFAEASLSKYAKSGRIGRLKRAGGNHDQVGLECLVSKANQQGQVGDHP